MVSSVAACCVRPSCGLTVIVNLPSTTVAKIVQYYRRNIADIQIRPETPRGRQGAVSGPSKGQGATESIHWEHSFAFYVSNGVVRDDDV